MPILIKTTNEVTVLAFEGKLDTLTSPDAEQQLTRLIEEGEKRFQSLVSQREIKPRLASCLQGIVFRVG